MHAGNPPVQNRPEEGEQGGIEGRGEGGEESRKEGERTRSQFIF